jgi:adenylate cyclase
LLGVLGTLLVALLYVAQPALLARLDWKTYDLLLPLRGKPPGHAPVIIDLDESSLAAYGQWPWPRYLVADLIRALGEYEVASVGLDIMFAEPDHASPAEMRAYLKRDRGIDVSFGGLPEELADYDGLLALALSENRAVLGAYARFDGEGGQGALPDSVNVIERAAPGAKDYKQYLAAAKGAVLPFPLLRDKAPLGLINVAPEEDGIVRQMPLVMLAGDKIYPSLALRALMLAMATKNLVVEYGPDGLEALRAASVRIPVSARGGFYIPFGGGRGVYKYISAADVLRGKAPKDALRGRIAFVGTSAPGLLDIRATPFDQVYPGVEVHAAVVDAILQENGIRRPESTPALQLAGILLAGAISTFAFGFARPRMYVPVAGLFIAAAVFLSRRFFAEGVFFSPLYVVLTVLFLGALLLLLRFWQEESQKIFLRNTFSRYVSPEVVKRIAKLEGDLFTGEERELSILFTDIRGFTSISENLAPNQIVGLLNRYFTPMTALVRDREGTLDKFIGDSLMAFWNAPLDTPEHAALAVDAALSMQERLHGLNRELKADFGVELAIGAGIHTGPAYVGNMGSADLVNYTLIGDSVNLASRLEGLCPQYGAGAVVSGETRASAGAAFAFQYLDTIRVKGKTLPVEVYAPLRREEAEERREELAAWDKARESYRAGRFDEAAALCGQLAAGFPGRKLYALYAARARELALSPPKEWAGVWTAVSK